MTYSEKDVLLIYRHTHPDYRGIDNGVHTILTNRCGATCLCAIKDLTPEEFAKEIEYARSRERRGTRPY